MSSDSLRGRAGASPLLNSVARGPHEIPERSFEEPSLLMERARTALEKYSGAGQARSGTGFAHGSMGLLAEHTHYFDGFALFFSLPSGAATTVRVAEGAVSRLALAEEGEVWLDGPDRPVPEAAPAPVRVVFETFRRLAPEGVQADIAVANAVPASCADACVATLAVATARACEQVFPPSGEARRACETAHAAIEASLDRSFSPAYLVAAEQGRPEQYSFVDAATLECMSLDAAPEDALAFGLVDTEDRTYFDPGAAPRKRKMADEAAAALRKKGFAGVTSLRELEHRDLPAATDALPFRLRPALRWLVKENQRVPKLVGAVQRKDWQLFGALLLMSDAVTRKDWGGTTEVSEKVVDEVDAMSMDGMYGAFPIHRGRAVVMAGQPFVVPRCLHRVRVALREKFGMDAPALLL